MWFDLSLTEVGICSMYLIASNTTLSSFCVKPLLISQYYKPFSFSDETLGVVLYQEYYYNIFYY